MPVLFVICSLLFTNCELTGDLPRSKDIFTYTSAPNDSLSIEEIVSHRQKYSFKKSRAYKRNLNDSILWATITIQGHDLHNGISNFLVSSDPHLNSGKAYIVKNRDTSISALNEFIHNKKNAFDFIWYRSAIWELPKDIEVGDKIYLRLKGNYLKNRIDFFIYDLNSFLKVSQFEYYWYGFLGSFLLSLAMVMLIYGFITNRLSIILYVLYIFFLVLDFYAFKGIAKQNVWYASDFFMINREYKYMLTTASLNFFFVYFYQYNKKNLIFRKLFQFLGIYGLVGAVISVINYFFTIHEDFFELTFLSLNYICIAYSIAHVILAIRKQIPIYLAVGFSIPLIGLATYQVMIPRIETGGSILARFLFLNLPYVAFTVEIMIIGFFIFERIAKVQKRYIRLKRINNTIKKNMTEMVIEAEINQRNKLLNNVHDSFGGAIEALKYGLKKDNSTQNIDKTVDHFYSQYRLILKNLDNPQVDSNNLEKYLKEYVEELSNIFKIRFNINIQVATIPIHKEYCLHVYYAYCELLTNAIKHAKASEISVDLVSKDSFLILTVSDNGVGMHKNIKMGYGLKFIKEKTEKLNGCLSISKSNTINNITLKIPLQP